MALCVERSPLVPAEIGAAFHWISHDWVIVHFLLHFQLIYLNIMPGAFQLPFNYRVFGTLILQRRQPDQCEHKVHINIEWMNQSLCYLHTVHLDLK